jgi:FixJ family two-component response regulator
MNTSHDTLFVVDDDPKSCKAVAALAASMKIQCEPFASAEEFLDHYNPSLTGCVLVDFRLSGMDGLELQDRLRAMGSALSVVLISDFADVPMAVRAMKNVAVAVIEKPSRNDALADAVRTRATSGVPHDLRLTPQPPNMAAGRPSRFDGALLTARTGSPRRNTLQFTIALLKKQSDQHSRAE